MKFFDHLRERAALQPKILRKRKRGEVKTSSKPTRIEWLDVTRAAAILIMIITHVVMITFDFAGNSTWDEALELVSLFGGTVSFTLFLFVSGATLYTTFLSTDDKDVIDKRSRNIFHKSIQVLLVYYALAFFLSAAYGLVFTSTDSELIARDIIYILSFATIPPLTEFLIPFFIFPIIAVLIRPLLKQLLQQKILLLLLAIGIYAVGAVAYEIEVSNTIFQVIKGLLVGNADDHTFPLLQYTIVYIGGVIFASTYNNLMTFKHKIQLVVAVGVVSSVFIGSSAIMYAETELTAFDPSWYTGRFPPSVAFIATGILTISLIVGIYESISHMIKERPTIHTQLFKQLWNMYLFIGKHALGFYIAHVIILGISVALDERFNYVVRNDSTLRALTFFFLLIGVIYSFIRLIPSAFMQRIIHRLNVVQKHGIPVLILFVTFSTLLASTYFYISAEPQPSTTSLARTVRMSTLGDWWNDDYSYRAPIQIEDELLHRRDYEFRFNLTQDSSTIQSSSGNDIQIIRSRGIT